MKRISIIACTLLGSAILLTASCKKTEIKDIQKAGDELVGTWLVNSIETNITDTMGNPISDDAVTNQGTVTFVRGDKSASATQFFDHADFVGACANSDLVLYFSNVAAGDAITNGWSLEWDADPEDLRVLLWGETGGGSYHVTLNHNFDGGQQFFYIVQPPYQNKRIFYTWKMTRK